MQSLRSIAFTAAFYVNTFLWTIAIVPTFLLPRRRFLGVIKAWVRSNLFLLRVICGIRVEFRGLENVPPGPLLVAAKHQSALETLALFLIVDQPTFILKRELTLIPLFGWYLIKGGQIAVNRKQGAAAMKDMLAAARAAVAEGRQILIFPEGTRGAPGAPPDYKVGVIQLYKALGVPCLPVALNTGLFWPRRSLTGRRPGVAVIEVLPPLPADLRRAEVLPRLREAIEPASERLLAEGRRHLDRTA